jgi:molybdopterin/thiamine biosynthesis adenylyltransferase
MLAKMGYKNITVYDYDTIEVENMNCQFYPFSAIGKPKVYALKELVKAFTDVDIIAHNNKFDFIYSDITIIAVDSMATRKQIFEDSMYSAACNQIIDARMGAEQAMMYSFSTHNEMLKVAYANSLYSDEDAVQEKCTAKSTVYTSTLIGGLIAKNVKDITLDSIDRVWSLVWNIKTNDLQSFKLKDV